MQKQLGILVASLLVLTHGLAAAAVAQSPAPAKPGAVSCSVRRAPMSAADIAFSHEDFAKAAELYHEESKAPGEEGEHAHNALVRALLRSGKVPDAEAEARAWVAKSPNDAWAMASAAEVDFRKADIDKAGAGMRAAIAANFCVAQTHADYAEYLAFSGYEASAKSQIEIAHKLDPIDDAISSTWIHYQPRAARLAAVTAYLERSKFLADKERKSWERERDALSAAPSAPCKLATPITSTSIPFHAIHNGNAVGGQQSNVQWGLVVSFNGKSRRLEIDTGAHGILLKRSAAAALALPVETHTQVGGVGDSGPTASSIAKVKDLTIGGLTFHDCAIEVLDKDTRITDDFRDIDMMEGQDGLIGGDVFQNFVLTLDFPGHVVKLDPLPTPPNQPGTAADASIQTGTADSETSLHDRYVDPSMASWTKVFRAGHMMIIPVRLNQGHPRLFIVDTGAGVPMLTPAAAKEVGNLSKSAEQIVGISGVAKNVYTTGPVTLDFAGLRQPSPGMLASDSFLRDSPVELSGLLGQVTLRQLTISIDYRDQLMKFTYDPNRIAHCVQNVTLDDCY